MPDSTETAPLLSLPLIPLDDVPAEVLAELTIHPVVTLEEALAVSLEPVAHWDMLTV